MLTTQKDRKDTWNREDDEILAETVLRHIKENSTQLEAFKEVGKQLKRTAGACGFRWNSYVRKQYGSEIQKAKQKRREEKKRESKNKLQSSNKQGKETLQEIHQNVETSQESPEPQKNKQEQPIENITQFIKDIYEKESRFTELNENLSLYKSLNSELKAKNFELSSENEKLKSELDSITRDYIRLSELIVQAKTFVIQR
ncbi:RsfA family transcriptional regulator [Mesobacillus foraminis]|uniref:RsfA family transcriptional regulator n=1 Tax=Mesobacillus foraminis TaxID=279826 RepID=UPI001BEA9879|nr:RsfA family transcriptional regulator [Mesobacillus foraminis]MBT2757981.1 RsfA family transcriptional regulator [Mesobacillus foraminis]